MKSIANRSSDINDLDDNFWRAVGNHVDSATPRDEAVEAFEALAQHIRKAQKINFYCVGPILNVIVCIPCLFKY